MVDVAIERGGPGWPPLLAGLAKPPERLYVRGSPQALLLPCVAVVGTRKASPAGLRAARDVGALLAQLGACAVSGLAFGCDAGAHLGAIAAGGATAAVLAHGLRASVYPREHGGLAAFIGNGPGVGALVTEYAADVPAAPWRFVARDRVQAALSLAVVLVESGETGGSFHAVRAARALGRPVFACVSSDASFKRAGANRAVEEFGARPVITTGQLARGLAPLLRGAARGHSAASSEEREGTS